MSYNLYSDGHVGDQHELLEYVADTSRGELYLKVDKATGLNAIVAIHSVKNGPALGGCRLLKYPSTVRAIWDALRLARAMSFKAALVNVPLGGGKAVLIKPEIIPDRAKYFRAFGQFIHSLDGRYITAVDSGTKMEDMDSIAEMTPYVISSKKSKQTPSLFTALGVLCGIEAAVHCALKRDSLKGIHVAIQGVGEVGFLLCQKLHHAGAQLTVADTDEASTQKCQEMFQANVVSPNEIHKIDADVFSPCALGAVINDNTIAEISAPIIAGAANNQLATAEHGQQLHAKGILFAVDYVINAGGLIYASGCYHDMSETDIDKNVHNIYDTLHEIFEKSKLDNCCTSDIAESMAQARLQ